jgi:hypothetical protein
MSYIFEELKSDKTNRVMSPEKDIRFEEKYTSTLTVPILQEPEMTREEIGRADEIMYMTEERVSQFER